VPLLTEPTAGAYLALTLSEQASFSNILITNIRRDAARSEIMVSFGDNRGPPPDTCPEDTNRFVITVFYAIFYKFILNLLWHYYINPNKLIVAIPVRKPLMERVCVKSG